MGSVLGPVSSSTMCSWSDVFPCGVGHKSTPNVLGCRHYNYATVAHMGVFCYASDHYSSQGSLLVNSIDLPLPRHPDSTYQYSKSQPGGEKLPDQCQLDFYMSCDHSFLLYSVTGSYNQVLGGGQTRAMTIACITFGISETALTSNSRGDVLRQVLGFIFVNLFWLSATHM